MRVLCSSVLVFEALILGLFIPVAIHVGGYPAGTVAVLGGGTAVLAILACGGLSKSWGIPVGWFVQGVMLASGLLVPMMFALGGVFGVLWWAALKYGRKAEEIRAANMAQVASGDGAIGRDLDQGTR